MYIQGFFGVYVGLYRANFMKGMPRNKWYFSGKSVSEVIAKGLVAIA